MKKAKLAAILFGILFSVVLTSCSTTHRFLNSSVVPAATGSVKVSRDTKDNITKNIGQPNRSSGFFSSEPEGDLVTVSPFKPDHIFLTAENNANIQYPEGTVVLTTKSH